MNSIEQKKKNVDEKSTCKNDSKLPHFKRPCLPCGDHFIIQASCFAMFAQ